MFRNFKTSDLCMIAIALEEEDNDNLSKRYENRKKIWVRDAFKNRKAEGEFRMLLPHLTDDETKFYEYFNMTISTFNQLLAKLQGKLKKKNTFWRLSITPKERLAVCLRFLTTGDAFNTISFNYKLGRSTVAEIVHDTCRAIVNVLSNEVMPLPNEDEWNSIADNFWRKWQFPNCIGALNGKRVTIQVPRSSNKTFSIVLLALVDPCCNFTIVDVGSYGENSDGGILANSEFGKSLQNDKLNIPKKRALPGSNSELPMVMLADEAFPLKTYMMRPFPGRNLKNDEAIYNYRLNRAKRVSENAFGILQQKFRIFTRRIQGTSENITTAVLAACILHNFIRINEGYTCDDQNQSQNATRSEKRTSVLQPLSKVRGRATDAAFAVRNDFKKFLNSPEGSMHGQEHATMSI